MLNQYVDEERLRRDVAAGRHREVIGGQWEELGQLQFDFLRARGLQVHHRLLDIGCGSGRLAVKAIPYLEASHYHGIDTSPSLLSAARLEVESIGFGHKLDEKTFRATKDFTPIDHTAYFDMGIAQSVFTHLPLDHLSACLRAVRPYFEQGRLFATFFVAPPGVSELRHDPGGILSYANRNPFHFSFEDILAAAHGVGWSANWIGDWGHPRDQKMCDFAPLT